MGKIFLQMYSFADGKHEDSRENLRTAASLGYDGVELFGPNLLIPPEELKSLLAELSLTPISLHTSTDKVEALLPFAKAIGLKYIGIGMELLKDEAAVHAFAKTLNRVGAACADQGLTLTYHNHTQEFAACGDSTIEETLMSETDPLCVAFELDAGWCAAAGVDPIAFVEKHRGRVKLVHIKESSEVVGPQPSMDFSAFPKNEKGMPVMPDEVKAEMERLKKINCPAGKGLVDWAALKKTADACGCEAYIVEREYSEGDRVEALKADLAVYREML